MDQYEFKKFLVERYVQNSATEEELEVFFHLLKQGELAGYISDAMIREEDRIGEAEKSSVKKIYKWAGVAAASVIIALAAIFYFSSRKMTEQNVVLSQVSKLKNDVAPGGNKAVLTLADGTQVILDSINNGEIINQGGVTVIKLDDGQLTYNLQKENTTKVLYNMITTPRSGQYQVELSDGSKVWLNAESSLKFPSVFTSKQRKVQLRGEGYFEVAHDVAKPFIVQVSGMDVKVLGTHFNINAYSDEDDIRTTLLEGKVELSNQKSSVILKPGEQARLQTSNNEFQTLSNVDLEQIVAWKDGKFYLSGADIRTVMNQIARWYDIEVDFKGEIRETFFLSISRNTRLSKVLDILETTGTVQFRVEGNKVTVSLPDKKIK